MRIIRSIDSVLQEAKGGEKVRKVCIINYTMNMEKFVPEGLERADISVIHGRAEKVMDKSRIKEKDFVNPYGQETIDRDLETVRRHERDFDHNTNEYTKEQKAVADIFEALVLENGELNDWFGPNAITHKTSKYDDYENGVDAIIEFQSEMAGAASFLGLAADVSFSADTSRKFDRLKEGILKGRLPQVKYFNSSDGYFHGKLSMIPEVVIGASKQTVLELAELWQFKRNKELATHRIQIMILNQMEEQMEVFARFAELNGQDEIARLYRDRLQIVRDILEGKRDIAKEAVKIKSKDLVHEGIMDFLKHWKLEMEREVSI